MRDTPRPLTHRQKIAVALMAAAFAWIATIASIHALGGGGHG